MAINITQIVLNNTNSTQYELTKEVLNIPAIRYSIISIALTFIISSGLIAIFIGVFQKGNISQKLINYFWIIFIPFLLGVLIIVGILVEPIIPFSIDKWTWLVK